MISDRYYRDFGLKPLLTKEQEAELGVRSLGGDTEARNALVEANLRLVLSYVKKHWKRQDFDDIVSAGNAGLIRAAEKFDPSKGFRFTTYAVWWIRQQVSEYFADSRGTGKYEFGPANKVAAHAADAGLSASSMSIEDICKLLGMTRAKGKTIKAAVTHLNRESNDHRKENLSTEESPVQHAQKKEMTAKLHVAMQNLDERKQTIIRWRFGFDQEALTLKECAQKLGICRERVRQLELAAIKTMKENLPKD